MDIKKLREAKKITRMELAKMMQVGYFTVKNWDSGAVKPNEENQRKLQEIFKEV